MRGAGVLSRIDWWVLALLAAMSVCAAFTNILAAATLLVGVALGTNLSTGREKP